jgi:hypothetical protein
MKYNYINILAASSVALLLTGCATNKSIYQWESYQPQVRDYLKGSTEGAEKQIITLEADLEKVKSKNGTPPPGYHAFLGMLYEKTGKHDLMLREFYEEKAIFPESAPYMDFLIRRYVK